uniref:Pleiotropic drug resistance protein 1 n=1 Tax=Rhizophora mucronata TaxID=61149 RepID=A0A2P2N467_RHIMU
MRLMSTIFGFKKGGICWRGWLRWLKRIMRSSCGSSSAGLKGWELTFQQLKSDMNT